MLGYEVIAGGGALRVNEQEAEQVREIFRLYLELGSPMQIIEELDRRGWRRKSFTTQNGRKTGNGAFTATTLYNLLTNPIYIGKVRHRGELYAGEQERIVTDAIWKKT